MGSHQFDTREVAGFTYKQESCQNAVKHKRACAQSRLNDKELLMGILATIK